MIFVAVKKLPIEPVNNEKPRELLANMQINKKAETYRKKVIVKLREISCMDHPSETTRITFFPYRKAKNKVIVHFDRICCDELKSRIQSKFWKKL